MAKKSVWDEDFDPEDEDQVADQQDDYSPQARRSCCLSLAAVFILFGCLLGYAFYRFVCWLMEVPNFI